jgi:hypothetical protein
LRDRRPFIFASPARRHRAVAAGSDSAFRGNYLPRAAGAARIFGFHKVSIAAAALEECADIRSGCDPLASVESDLAALVDCIERE